MELKQWKYFTGQKAAVISSRLSSIYCIPDISVFHCIHIEAQAGYPL